MIYVSNGCNEIQWKCSNHVIKCISRNEIIVHILQYYRKIMISCTWEIANELYKEK